MKPINVGLLGIGTVGGGTFEVLARNQEEITRRAGRGIVISMVADKDVERARKLGVVDVLSKGATDLEQLLGKPVAFADDRDFFTLIERAITYGTV